jgi:helix-turn-helix resolvase-like protein
MTKRPSTKRTGRKSSAKAKPRATKIRPEAIELPPPKRGRGRPTTYDPSFCDRVIELGEEGKSKAQIARALGCSRKSMYLWMKVHPEFAEAMEEAEFAAMGWFEDVGQVGLSMGNKFNASLYSYLMKNRFRAFYSDKVDLAHSGTVQSEEPEMTDLELARRIAFVFGEAMRTKREQEQLQLNA